MFYPESVSNKGQVIDVEYFTVLCKRCVGIKEYRKEEELKKLLIGSPPPKMFFMSNPEFEMVRYVWFISSMLCCVYANYLNNT
jgi:hypothetical protein